MKTIEELEQEIQELYEKINDMKEELQEVELDPKRTQKEKDREVAILRFHLQENANYRFVLEGQLNTRKKLEEHRKNNPVVEVEQEEEIIPRQYLYLVNNLKQLQNNQEKRIKEDIERAKRYNTVVNQDYVNEKRRILNMKIRSDLAFLCSNNKTKKELEKIFKIKL